MAVVTNSLFEGTTATTLDENATPHIIGSSDGGVASVMVTTRDIEDSDLLYLDPFSVKHPAFGTKNVRVLGLTATRGGGLTVTGVDEMQKFVANKTVLPFVGTADAAMAYYAGLAGITTTITGTAGTAALQVTCPGWKGDLWTGVKDFLVYYGLELAHKGDTIYFREQRTRYLQGENIQDAGYSLGDSGFAQTIAVPYFEWEYVVDGDLYSPDERDIITADASETVTVDVEVNASVLSVNQPEFQEWVSNRSYDDTMGVFSVSGSDGKPITAEQWAAQNGMLRVEMTDDPSVLRVIFRAPTMTQYAPYHVAMTSGEYYNSLHITGTGVRKTPDKEVRLPTGAPPDLTSDEIGESAETIFPASYDDALYHAQFLAIKYSGVYKTRTITGRNFNYGWGDLVGSLYRGAYDVSRVVAASYDTNDMVSLTLVPDTRMSDFEAVWNGKTGAEFAATWDGRSGIDFSLRPLEV